MELEYKDGCGGHGLKIQSCHLGHYCQLNTYDYLVDVPGNAQQTDIVEVQFKNTRKAYFHNSYHLPLQKGDIVAVEANPGHDIGVVSVTGRLALMQMRKSNPRGREEIRNIYRLARPLDMERYAEAKAREHDTMIQSRQIAKRLKLDMKIGDVEYQGDGNKALFYYIADGRVDFRQLIKVLAETFRVRVEMRQIGVRQEAGRIGGFGPCGRELCCASWIRGFVSVSTGVARVQDLSLNPQKLAGQCAKLKCCINFEADQYIEAARHIPQREVVLQTADADYYQFKADLLAGVITYSTDRHMAANLVTISTDRAAEVIALNKVGQKPLSLAADGAKTEGADSPMVDLATQEDVNRFDGKKSKHRRQGGKSQAKNGQPAPKKEAQAKKDQPRPKDKPAKERRRPKPDKKQPPKDAPQ